MLKKLPIGIQTFSEIIEENYLYVDKTKQIYELITTGKTYFYPALVALANHYLFLLLNKFF